MRRSRLDTALGRRRLARLGLAALAGLVPAAIGPRRDARAATIAGSEKKCATCDFWTGPRQVAADGAGVVVPADATGACTNPKSPLYQKQSRATQGFVAGHVRWSMLK